MFGSSRDLLIHGRSLEHARVSGLLARAFLVLQTGCSTICVLSTENVPGSIDSITVVMSGGDPTSDDDDDPATPTFVTTMDLEKEVTAVIDDGAGAFTTVYTLSVENTGNEPLITMQVTDVISDYPAGSVATDWTIPAP